MAVQELSTYTVQVRDSSHIRCCAIGDSFGMVVAVDSGETSGFGGEGGKEKGERRPTRSCMPSAAAPGGLAWQAAAPVHAARLITPRQRGTPATPMHVAQ
jgi:hypothetical protein